MSNVWPDLTTTFIMEWYIWLYSCFMTRKQGDFSETMAAVVVSTLIF